MLMIGMEGTGYAPWFERMLAEQGHELWVGNAARIRAAVVRKQGTDSRDALHILQLLLEDRFPWIWVPSPAEQDARRLLRRRHKLVCFRTSVKNQLHALAMGQGGSRKTKLWMMVARRELERLTPGPWASHRRQELLEMLDRLNLAVEALAQAVVKEAENCSEAVLLIAGSRASDGAGVCAHAGTGRPLPEQQVGGELSGAESP